MYDAFYNRGVEGLTVEDFRALQEDLDYHREDMKVYNRDVVRSPLTVAGNSVSVTGLVNRYLYDKGLKGQLKHIYSIYDNSLALTMNVAYDNLNFNKVDPSFPDGNTIKPFVGNPALEWIIKLWYEMTDEELEESARWLFTFNDEATKVREETDNLQKKGKKQIEARRIIKEYFVENGYDNYNVAFEKMKPLLFLFTTLTHGIKIPTDKNGMFQVHDRALNRWVVNKVSYEDRVHKKFMKWWAWMEIIRNVPRVDFLSNDWNVGIQYDFNVQGKEWIDKSFIYLKPPIDTRSPDDTSMKASNDPTSYYTTEGIHHYFTTSTLADMLQWMVDANDTYKVPMIMQYGIKINKYGDKRLNEGQRMIYGFLENNKEFRALHIDPMSYNKNTIGSNGLMHNNYETDFFIVNF